jgi:hypothetical protein
VGNPKNRQPNALKSSGLEIGIIGIVLLLTLCRDAKKKYHEESYFQYGIFTETSEKAQTWIIFL